MQDHFSNSFLAARRRGFGRPRGPNGGRPAMVPGVSRIPLLYGGSAMRTYDLTPLWRSTVGFDRLFNLLEDTSRWAGEEHSYPPYNIERTGDDRYQIALAVAGFSPEDITITAEQNVLTVEGRKPEKAEHQYLYQGIS